MHHTLTILLCSLVSTVASIEEAKIKIEPKEEQFTAEIKKEFAPITTVKVELELEQRKAVKKEPKEEANYYGLMESKSNRFREIEEGKNDSSCVDHSDEDSAKSDQSEGGLTLSDRHTDQNGQSRKRMKENDRKKMEIYKEYRKMKETTAKSDPEIAKIMGVNISMIRRLKEKFGQNLKSERKNDCQRREILNKFFKMKKERFLCDGKNKTVQKIEEEISEELQVTRKSIYNWIKKFGMKNASKIYSDEDKRSIVKQFKKLRNEKQKVKEIPKMLGIGVGTFYKWKDEFSDEEDSEKSVQNDSNESDRSILPKTDQSEEEKFKKLPKIDYDSADDGPPPFDSKAWAWNFSVAKRKNHLKNGIKIKI